MPFSATDRLSSIYILLRLTYGLVPVVAGLDKFTNILVDWSGYLPPVVGTHLPVSPSTFMMVVGAGPARTLGWPGGL